MNNISAVHMSRVTTKCFVGLKHQEGQRMAEVITIDDTALDFGQKPGYA